MLPHWAHADEADRSPVDQRAVYVASGLGSQLVPLMFRRG